MSPIYTSSLRPGTDSSYSSNEGGGIIQMKCTKRTSGWSTSSNSWVEYMNVSITPVSSSSRIWISAYFNYTTTSGNRFAYARLDRNGTAIGQGDSNGPRERCWGDIAIQNGVQNIKQHPVTMQWIDEPGTTSTRTYYLRIKNKNGAAYYFNYTPNGDDGLRSSTPTILSAWEVSA